MAEYGFINLEPAKANNVVHNDRTVSPSYLLQENSLGVEVNHNAKEAQIVFDNLFKEACTNYTKRTHQKLQSKKIKWSGVLLIKDTTTMQDIENLVEVFNKKYGWQCYQIAIHRDEGHIDKLTKKTVYNLHAHLEFFMLNKQGIYCYKKRDFGKKAMSELQTLVAKELGMKRGIDARISNKKHLNHYQFRQHKKDIDKIKLKAASLISELNTKNKAESEAKFKDLLDQTSQTIQNYKADIENLQIELKQLKSAKKKVQKRVVCRALNYRRSKKEISKKIDDLKKQIKALESTNNDLQKQLEKLNIENQKNITTLNEKNLKLAEQEMFKKKVKSKCLCFKGDTATTEISDEQCLSRIDIIKDGFFEQRSKVTKLEEQVKNLKSDLATKPKEITVTKEVPVEVVKIKEVEVEHKLTQAEIKSFCESARKKLIAEGWHSKEDYQKLSEFKKETLSKLKIKSDVAPLSDEEFFTRLDNLMNELSQKPKEVEKQVVVKRELSDEEIELLPRVKELKIALSNSYNKAQLDEAVNNATANTVSFEEYNALVNDFNDIQNNSDELRCNLIDLLFSVTGDSIDENISNDDLNNLANDVIVGRSEMEEHVKSQTRRIR